MLNRLSGPSLRLRVGIGMAMLAGAGASMAFDWTWPTGVIAAVVGIASAIAVGDKA